MQHYTFHDFGLDHLQLTDAPTPSPGPGEIVLDVHAFSLNYRDLLVITGAYNPKLTLPATPISDAAGVVAAVGEGVTRVRVGDRVMTHFIADWRDGPFKVAYRASTLGTPGPGFAAEQVAVSAEAVVPIPASWTFENAATLPIAALTAWSSLKTVTNVTRGQTVLTLGTGGVSVFVLQLAKALHARVIITSRSDEKLERCRALGANETINYAKHPDWDRRALDLTNGEGVDVTVDLGGPKTLDQSVRATRPEGVVALPGALTGRSGEINTGLILARRTHIAGVFVDSRKRLEEMNSFLAQHLISPAIHEVFPFDRLSEAFHLMQRGGHFGKIVISRSV